MDSPDFDESNESATTIVGAIVAVIAAISVVLRFYTRHMTTAGLGSDDWLILLALIATIATDVIVLVASSNNPGGARAASNIDPDYVYTPADVEYTKLDFIATVLYFTITCATKLSIVLMYKRIFGVGNTFRRRIFVVSFIVIGFWIGTTVADLLNCIPIKWTWLNSHDDPQYCFSYTIFWLVSGITEALIDIIILAMPIQIVISLHLKTSRKVAIGGVFLLGSLVVISGIVKVVLSYVPGNREPDFSKTEVWTTVHIGTGILCACLPVCWPLFIRIARASRTKTVVSSVVKLMDSISGRSFLDRTQRSREGSISRTLSSNSFELPLHSPPSN
ncbi:hypothetical protein F5Y18DRAFT_396519 [Xylariaceae sp. FL1019]|nr:hypothetical protein F5Y18DRAFT_396519 [Xylariaceae sp. FL1019]